MYLRTYVGMYVCIRGGPVSAKKVKNKGKSVNGTDGSQKLRRRVQQAPQPVSEAPQAQTANALRKLTGI